MASPNNQQRRAPVHASEHEHADRYGKSACFSFDLFHNTTTYMISSRTDPTLRRRHSQRATSRHRPLIASDTEPTIHDVAAQLDFIEDNLQRRTPNEMIDALGKLLLYVVVFGIALFLAGVIAFAVVAFWSVWQNEIERPRAMAAMERSLRLDELRRRETTTASPT